MQLPNANTPTDKCLTLAAYATRMLGKFTERARLKECAERIEAGGQELNDAQEAYETLLKQALTIRVDASFENYLSDQQLRSTQRNAQNADGVRGGRIATTVFPRGTTSIVRLQGESQITAMRKVEALLDGVVDIWPEAAADREVVAMRRSRYEEALIARKASELAIKNALVHRDATKRRFLDLYAEVAALVKAEFPRNRAMQDLLFDAVRTRSGSRKRPGDASPEPANADNSNGDAPVAGAA